MTGLWQLAYPHEEGSRAAALPTGRRLAGKLEKRDDPPHAEVFVVYIVKL